MEWERLKNWFIKERRDLPWREKRTPYTVWVSEVMLQQTQVAVVIPYFERWMARFPTLASLAEADLDEVIKLWEGLGYYSRARNLHAAAKKMIETWGTFPSCYEDLIKIKGLGPYTAGAICSLAFGKNVAAVDGNVMRVLTRYFQIEDDISKPKTVKGLQALAQSLLPEGESGTFNEALIELGALICQKKPKCYQCPLQTTCKAFRNQATESLPFKSAKIETTTLYRSVAIIQWNDCLLIKRIPSEQLMGDLHEFPYFESSEKEYGEERVCRHAAVEAFQFPISVGTPLTQAKHSFTRFRVRLQPFHFHCLSKKKPLAIPNYHWKERNQLKELPFSSGHRRLLIHFI